jgi:glycosyltransferase involved in cell wall biosynthesis
VIARLEDSRIRYIRHEQNQGAAAARNTAIKASLGQYIAFQDSDDEWLPGKLARQVEILSSSAPEIGVVYSSFWRIHGQQKSIFPPKVTKLASLLPLKSRNLAGDIHHSLLRGNFITPQAALVRKACFEKAGLFDERMPRFQDWELWLRIAKHYQFKYIDQPLVSLYFTPGSISANQRALAEAFELILAKHCEDFHASQQLLAQHLYATGDLLYQSGQLSKGKDYLFKALRLSPFSAVFWLAAVMSLFGPTLYTKVVKSIGISYAP